MKILEKKFTEKENGFDGNYKIISLKVESEEFKYFLKNHTYEYKNIFDLIRKQINNIVIIQNLNIKKEYQGKGYGSQLLKEIIDMNKTCCFILSCDVTKNQRFGFNLEYFYECHDFKAIEYYQDFPLMLHPKNFALKLLNLLPS